MVRGYDPFGGGIDLPDRAVFERALKAGRISAGDSSVTGTSWAPMDLGAVLEAGCNVAAPQLLRRTDGQALFYRACIHSANGEPESGKSKLAGGATAQVLRSGGRVAYFDCESRPEPLLEQLQAAGVSDSAIIGRLGYVRPHEPLSHAEGDLVAELALEPDLVVLDGVTEAMQLAGMKLEDNADVAAFMAALPRRFADAGSAVLMIDHVVKDRESRGRYAIGGQHKLAAVDVAFSLKVLEPFGRGKSGAVAIQLEKDRPGHLRALADGKRIAVMRVDAASDGEFTIDLEPPGEHRPGGFRPTVLMERVSEFVAANPGLSKNAIRAGVKGRNDAVDLALELLVSEKFVRVAVEGQRHLHHPVRPFEHVEEGTNE